MKFSLRLSSVNMTFLHLLKKSSMVSFIFYTVDVYKYFCVTASDPRTVSRRVAMLSQTSKKESFGKIVNSF